MKANERSIEYGFTFRSLADISPETVLDVGTGISAFPRLMMQCGFVVGAIDNIKDYWPAGLVNKHFPVRNDDITDPKTEERFDFITCISVLEHITDYEKAVKGMFGLLNPGGYIVMTVPYNETEGVENIYDHPEVNTNVIADRGCRVFSRDVLKSSGIYGLDDDFAWSGDTVLQIVAQEYWRIFEGDFWQIGERLENPCKVAKYEKHHLACMLIQKTT